MKNLLILVALLTTISCVKEPLIKGVEDSLESDVTTSYRTELTWEDYDFCDDLTSAQKLIGVHAGQFIDNLAKNGIDYFDSCNTVMLSAIISVHGSNYGLTRNQFVHYYSTYHNIPDSLPANFADDIITYATIMTGSTSDTAIYMNSVLCNMQEIFTETASSSTQVLPRWIFAAVATWFGAPCGVIIAANIWDAGFAGATAVLSAPSVAGAIIGTIGVIGHIGSAVHNATTNCGQN